MMQIAAALVVLALWGLATRGGWRRYELNWPAQSEWLLAGLLLAMIALWSAPLTAVAFLIAIYLQELGHVVAAHALGVKVPFSALPLAANTGGWKFYPMTSGQRIWVALCGPATAIPLAMVTMLVYAAFINNAQVVNFFLLLSMMNAAWAFIRLLPFSGTPGGVIIGIAGRAYWNMLPIVSASVVVAVLLAFALAAQSMITGIYALIGLMGILSPAPLFPEVSRRIAGWSLAAYVAVAASCLFIGFPMLIAIALG